ncbi:MAG: thymidine phosphorylase [Chloroflexi bacterium]|nr:thymidine phosphorylase [Chloroflexota bacterium]
MSRSILRLIARKRDGQELSKAEIDELVANIASGEIPDYQLGAMLMAIYLQGMTDAETAHLTMAMVHSGEVIDLSAIPGFKADKHSTGGVGDKVTPILAPLVASAGVRFPKLSGRGLGHTGGTLDKLESIPGFRVDLSIEEFIRQVSAIGVAVTGQTGELVPADGIIYGLRDLTATVDSIPLIASSVMSKKIAAGADGIVLDVKCGRGAFMQTPEQAMELARLMVAIGRAAGKRTTAIVTSMEEPLGEAVGNALEMDEAIATLRGEKPPGDHLLDVSLLLGAHLLVMAGKVPSVEDGKELLADRLRSGAAREKLRELIRWQGGNATVVDEPALLPRAATILPVPSPSGGFVQRIDTRQIGAAVMELGAGRKVKGEAVDHAVGLVLAVRPGAHVELGQSLGSIHTNGRIPDDEALRQVLAAFDFGPQAVEPPPHVLHVVTDD